MADEKIGRGDKPPYPPEFDPKLHPEITYPPEYDPALHQNLEVFKNGVVYDHNVHHIVYAKNMTSKITTENARAYREKQREMKKAAFEKGFADEVRASGMMRSAGTDHDYLEVVGAKTARILLDSENARGYAEVLNTSMKLLGAISEGKEESGAVSSIMDNIPPGTIMMIAKLAQDNPEVIEMIDGQFTESED